MATPHQHSGEQQVLYRRENGENNKEAEIEPVDSTATGSSDETSSSQPAAETRGERQTQPVSEPEKTKVETGDAIHWQGRPDHRNLIGLGIMLLLGAIVTFIIAFIVIHPLLEEEYFDFLVIGTTAVVGTLFLVFLGNVYNQLLATYYKISTERIFLYRGWVTKRIDEIEMITVRDIRSRQTIWQRLFGIGNVIVYSGDDTHPEFTLQGIRDWYEVKEMIRRLSQDIKIERKMLFSQSIG